MASIDLNADVGEGTGHDEALFAIVSSASIACGGHAGNPGTMRAALRAARRNGVAAGAHPGFADPAHFGRRRLTLPIEAVLAQVIEQIETLMALGGEEAVAVRYVKLHGALANMTAEDDALAIALYAAVKGLDAGLMVLALENSAQERAGRALGMEVVTEAYADRAYLADGLLAPRALDGSVIEDTEAVVARCLRLVRKGEIVALDGTVLRSSARSICVHGDNANAVALAGAIREALAAETAIRSPFLP